MEETLIIFSGLIKKFESNQLLLFIFPLTNFEIKFNLKLGLSPRARHRFYDNSDYMIWIQPAPWSHCCVLG